MTTQPISRERIQEIVSGALDAMRRPLRADEPRSAVALAADEVIALCGMADAGLLNLDALFDRAAMLSPKPGGLLVLRHAAPTLFDVAALQSALSALAEAFKIRVIAIEPSSKLEEVSIDELGPACVSFLEALDFDVASIVNLPAVARTAVASFAGQGLAIMKSSRQ